MEVLDTYWLVALEYIRSGVTSHGRMLLIPSYTSPYPMHALHAQAWLATIAAENPQHAAHTCMPYMRMHASEIEVERCDAVLQREKCVGILVLGQLLGRPRFVPQEQERCSDRFDSGRQFLNPGSRANVGVGGGNELMA